MRSLVDSLGELTEDAINELKERGLVEYGFGYVAYYNAGFFGKIKIEMEEAPEERARLKAYKLTDTGIMQLPELLERMGYHEVTKMYEQPITDIGQVKSFVKGNFLGSNRITFYYHDKQSGRYTIWVKETDKYI